MEEVPGYLKLSGKIFFATICPENIFACFHNSNLMLFVLDMMNIHDPGVPAASGQCPRLADGAVQGVLSPHHLSNN